MADCNPTTYGVRHAADATVPATIEDAIEAAALGPARVQVGNESVEARSIPDLIAADQYMASKQAAKRNHLGIRFSQIIPPGAG